jgi:hypothetical protein
MAQVDRHLTKVNTVDRIIRVNNPAENLGRHIMPPRPHPISSALLNLGALYSAISSSHLLSLTVTPAPPNLISCCSPWLHRHHAAPGSPWLRCRFHHAHATLTSPDVICASQTSSSPTALSFLSHTCHTSTLPVPLSIAHCRLFRLHRHPRLPYVIITLTPPTPTPLQPAHR